MLRSMLRGVGCPLGADTLRAPIGAQWREFRPNAGEGYCAPGSWCIEMIQGTPGTYPAAAPGTTSRLIHRSNFQNGVSPPGTGLGRVVFQASRLARERTYGVFHDRGGFTERVSPPANGARKNRTCLPFIEVDRRAPAGFLGTVSPPGPGRSRRPLAGWSAINGFPPEPAA